MKNSKLLKSCLALSMVLGTNGYLITNVSAEGEGTTDTENTNDGSTGAQAQDVTNNEGQGTDSGSDPTTTDYSSLITDTLTYNEDNTATLTIALATADNVCLNLDNADDATFQQLYNSGKLAVNETNTSYKSLAFNIAEAGTYTFVVGVYSLDTQAEVTSKTLTVEVSDLSGEGSVDTEYKSEPTANATFNINSLKNVQLAYFKWNTESDTTNITAADFTSVTSEGKITVPDYTTSSNSGYILFFVKPNDNYLFTGLDPTGAGHTFIVGSGVYTATDGKGIGQKDNDSYIYPGLENVINAANDAGYLAVFGYTRTSGQAMTQDISVEAVQPELLVAATASKESDVAEGDELTFNVEIDPKSNSSSITDYDVTGVTVTSAKINGTDVAINDLSYDSTKEKYVGTVNYTVTQDDVKSGNISLSVTASATYKCSIATSGAPATTTATVSESTTATATVSSKAPVTYSFVSGTTGKDLPSAVTDLLPTTEDKNTGTVTPTTLTKKRVEDAANEGYWTFDGWDAQSKEMNFSGTSFTGTWTFHDYDSITITTPSGNAATKVYDGTALNPSATADGATLTYYTKNSSGEWVEYKGTGAPGLTDAGTLEVKVKATKTGYKTTEAEYVLTVTQRSVTFTGQTDSRTYTGSEINLTDVTVGGDGLVANQTSNVTASAKGTDVKDSPYQGTITEVSGVKITDASGKNVTSNYSITTTPGQLTITKAKNLDISSGLENEKTKNVKERAYDTTPLTTTATSKTAGTTIKYQIWNGQAWVDYTGTTAPSITNFGELKVKAIASNPNYEDAEVEYTLKVTKADVYVVVASDSKVYGQSNPTFEAPSVSGLYSNTDLGEIKVVRTQKGEDAKTYTEDLTIRYTPNDNYQLHITKGNFTIKAQSLDPNSDDYTGATVNSPDDVVYDGKEHAWIPTITSGTTTLGKNDYTIKYYRDGVETTDFTNVGEITVVIEGKGNYTGTITKTYKITPAPIEEDDESDTPRFDISNLDSVVYNGTSQEQAPIIKDGENELVEGKDYTITYSEDTTNAGEVTVIIDGIGNYSGKVVKTYAIMKAKSTASLTGITTKYNGSNQTLVTDAKAEGGTIYYSLDGKTYSTTMPEKKEAGTYTIYYYVKGDKNHEDLGSETEPLTVEAKITEEAKVETKSKVKTSTATHTLFFETIGVAAAGMFIALKRK